MSKSEPLRTKQEIDKIKNYFLEKNDIRDFALFTLGINSALRVGDLLGLKWEDVYNFNKKAFREHITIREQKTKKIVKIKLNQPAKNSLKMLKSYTQEFKPQNYIFQSRLKVNRPIHRTRAYIIIKEAAKANNIEGVICCHSMRKTFGYHAWKKGFPPAIIMDIYNHSSIEITKRYLSITQDEKDDVFQKISL